MTPDIITRLEAATEPTRELSRLVARAVGWHRVEPRHAKNKYGAWIAPQDFIGVMSDGSPILDGLHGTTLYREPPDFTSSLDATLSLGRNEREKREILAAIYDNANETYPIARCIMFGCAAALRALSAQQKENSND